jgi:hypothetical protein
MPKDTAKELELNPYVPVTGQTLPPFRLQAGDDPIDTVKNSQVHHAALNKALVSPHAHGGHGFGLRPAELSDHSLAQLVETWLATIAIIAK